MTVVERLLSKIAVDLETGCWNWTAYVSPRNGYGQIWAYRRKWRVHRLSYILHRGEIPDGIDVCHHCDNRACVNPDHLFLGTRDDNMADMVAKGRQRPCIGTKHGRAKITEADVIEIRAIQGIPHTKIAQQYGISKTQVSTIRAGKYWKHVGHSA